MSRNLLLSIDIGVKNLGYALFDIDADKLEPIKAGNYGCSSQHPNLTATSKDICNFIDTLIKDDQLKVLLIENQIFTTNCKIQFYISGYFTAKCGCNVIGWSSKAKLTSPVAKYFGIEINHLIHSWPDRKLISGYILGGVPEDFAKFDEWLSCRHDTHEAILQGLEYLFKVRKIDKKKKK